MESWFRILVLSVGGALGVNARYWLGVWMSRWAGHSFPWATFTINVSGSFAIGFLTTLLAHWLPHPHARLLVLVGFLGGYTTFSTFSMESLTLWESGAVAKAWANVIGSVVAGLGAVLLGTLLARGLVALGHPRPIHSSSPALHPPAQPAPSSHSHPIAGGTQPGTGIQSSPTLDDEDPQET